MKKSDVNDRDEFRDSVATISKEGKRNWMFPQRPHGRLYRARTIVSIFYLLLFFGLPFIKVNGDPFFLFNFIERKFIFFGVTFWPQDFFIFGIGMLAFILFVVLFTVAFGRVFCGWACPQTIFMEMVFRKIEYFIEGDAARQIALSKMHWNAEKIFKKASKHLLFFITSFLIANTFLSYVIGADRLIAMIIEPLRDHIGTFISLLIFTGVFYGVYSWFREQVCIIACPYGRLQGVMTDKNTIVVAYDYERGEPRSKFTKDKTTTHGDCIDCFQCVKVCPTGIDIRNGTQLECVSCTACIDVCDFMMAKTGKPTGLIRYASEQGISKKEKLKATPRIKAYVAVLSGLLVFLGVLLITRKDVDTTVLRTPGMLYQEQEKDMISNLYNVKAINKTHKEIPLTFKLESSEGEIRMVGKEVIISPESKAESAFFIYLPKTQIHNRKTTIEIGVYQGSKKLETIKTSFLGPVNQSTL